MAFLQDVEAETYHKQQQTMDLYFVETNAKNVQQWMQKTEAASNRMNL